MLGFPTVTASFHLSQGEPIHSPRATARPGVLLAPPQTLPSVLPSCYHGPLEMAQDNQYFVGLHEHTFAPIKRLDGFVSKCDDRLGGRFAECCHRCREPSAHISSPTENQHLCPLTYPSGSLQVPSWLLILWKERKHRDFLSFVQDM